MLKKALILGLTGLSVLSANGPAQAFCGFYVAKADAKLFNKASKVVISHQALGPAEHQIAITMASDYVGDPKEFAVVTPRAVEVPGAEAVSQPPATVGAP